MATKKKKPAPKPSPPKTLRARAEEMLRTARTEIAGMPAGDVHALVHELQVHQMELEIQNEELREAQVELAESLDCYSCLYEFAPVGYLSLEQDGRILEANLTAATILGVPRQELAGSNITRFVAPEDQDNSYRHRQTVLSSDATAQTRGISQGLHPVGSYPEDLMNALRALASQVHSAGTAICLFSCDLPVPIDDPAEKRGRDRGEVRRSQA